jgi:hypothetical protein
MKLPGRSEILKRSNYHTKRGSRLRNADLLELLAEEFALRNIQLVKVSGHKKAGKNRDLHREADKLARKKLREHIKLSSVNVDSES